MATLDLYNDSRDYLAEPGYACENCLNEIAAHEQIEATWSDEDGDVYNTVLCVSCYVLRPECSLTREAFGEYY